MSSAHDSTQPCETEAVEANEAAPEKARPPNPLHHLTMGYPKLAGHMGLIPETMMFRRFGALNARNLLYYQSELVHIEQSLEELEHIDSKSKIGQKASYALDHFWINIADPIRDGDNRQKLLVERMRELLK
jgi:hypothetical protein